MALIQGNPNFCDGYKRLGYCPCGECHGYVCDLCARISMAQLAEPEDLGKG